MNAVRSGASAGSAPDAALRTAAVAIRNGDLLVADREYQCDIPEQSL
jgi:hypothetical protein